MITNPDIIPASVFRQARRYNLNSKRDPLPNKPLLTYIPPKREMRRDDWPTLRELIDSDQRLIVMIDKGADENEQPWLLDMYNYVWTTPTQQTDTSFPCDVEHPLNQARDLTEDKMYTANHVLYFPIRGDGLVAPALVPASRITAQEVNNNESMWRVIEGCSDKWHHAPNFIMVDFYDKGSNNGSVLQAASDANGVVYPGNCCGKERRWDSDSDSDSDTDSDDEAPHHRTRTRTRTNGVGTGTPKTSTVTTNSVIATTTVSHNPIPTRPSTKTKVDPTKTKDGEQASPSKGMAKGQYFPPLSHLFFAGMAITGFWDVWG